MNEILSWNMKKNMNMKIERKIERLLENGLSIKTILNMSNDDIHKMYDKVLMEVKAVTSYEIDPARDANTKITLPPDKKNMTVSKTKDNKLVLTPTTEEIGENKRKKTNPYAICTSSIAKTAGTSKRSEWSKDDEKRYEACKKDVEKSLKEGKNPVSLFLEQQIEKIVERHISPKIKKIDLMNYLLESPSIAPSKPQTKPDVKPSTKPRPSSPGKNPFPGEHPSPKAKEDNLPSPEDAKKEVIDLIMNIIQKS